eukprot:764718-Hanusia_phi.AAC.1
MSSSCDSGNPEQAKPGARESTSECTKTTPEDSVGRGKDCAKVKKPEVIKWTTLMQDQQLRPEYVKLMVVGESGLGKTTSIRCILHRYGEAEGDVLQEMPDNSKTLEIREYPPVTIQTDDPSRPIVLSIIDTPGYGEHTDMRLDFAKISGHITAQWEQTYKEIQQGVTSEGSELPSRHLVSACLYFIAPHRLKPIDVDFMREVSKKVPIIPVIAKSDTMTRDETQEFRRFVASKLSSDPDIRLYPWMTKNREGELCRDSALGDETAMPPFAIIAAKNYECREYAWGTCRLDDSHHSDFTLLRRLILGRHLLSLKQEALETFKQWKKQKDAKWKSSLLFAMIPRSRGLHKLTQQLVLPYLTVLLCFLLGALLLLSVRHSWSVENENQRLLVENRRLQTNNMELQMQVVKLKEEAQNVSRTCWSEAEARTQNSKSEVIKCQSELQDLNKLLKKVQKQNVVLESNLTTAKEQYFTFVFMGFLLGACSFFIGNNVLVSSR